MASERARRQNGLAPLRSRAGARRLRIRAPRSSFTETNPPTLGFVSVPLLRGTGIDGVQRQNGRGVRTGLLRSAAALARAGSASAPPFFLYRAEVASLGFGSGMRGAGLGLVPFITYCR